VLLDLSNSPTKDSGSGCCGSNPARAVDKDLSQSNLPWGRCQQWTSVNDAWWAVDLGSQKRVTKVKLYNRNDCCPERLQGVKIHLGNSFTDRSSNREVASNVNVPQHSPLTVDINAVGRYLFVSKQGGGLTLCEIQVYATAVKTCVKENGFCVKANGGDQNSGVNKLNSDNCDSSTCQADCLARCQATSGATGCEVIWNQGNRGCYVHTRSVDRGNNVGNHACWIFSKCAAAVASPALISQGKPVSMSDPSDQGGNGVASKAVDGDTSQSWGGRSCTHTPNTRNPTWWKVELGANYKVNNVKVWNRSDCCGGRLNGFQLFVGSHKIGGDHGITQGGVKDVLCGNKEGSSVKISLPRKDHLTLCEVQVYGTVARL